MKIAWSTIILGFLERAYPGSDGVPPGAVFAMLEFPIIFRVVNSKFTQIICNLTIETVEPLHILKQSVGDLGMFGTKFLRNMIRDTVLAKQIFFMISGYMSFRMADDSSPPKQCRI